MGIILYLHTRNKKYFVTKSLPRVHIGKPSTVVVEKQVPVYCKCYIRFPVGIQISLLTSKKRLCHKLEKTFAKLDSSISKNKKEIEEKRRMKNVERE